MMSYQNDHTLTLSLTLWDNVKALKLNNHTTAHFLLKICVFCSFAFYDWFIRKLGVEYSLNGHFPAYCFELSQDLNDVNVRTQFGGRATVLQMRGD